MNTATFETGATSAAVNELILYTDNTRELAESRDTVYEKILALDSIHGVMAMNFVCLLNAAEDKYVEQFGIDNSGHIIGTSDEQDMEYCTIYANRFTEWKRERELQAKQK